MLQPGAGILLAWSLPVPVVGLTLFRLRHHESCGIEN